MQKPGEESKVQDVHKRAKSLAADFCSFDLPRLRSLQLVKPAERQCAASCAADCPANYLAICIFSSKNVHKLSSSLRNFSRCVPFKFVAFSTSFLQKISNSTKSYYEFVLVCSDLRSVALIYTRRDSVSSVFIHHSKDKIIVTSRSLTGSGGWVAK